MPYNQNPPSRISRETYIKADEETYRALTYDMLNRIYEMLDSQEETYTTRMRDRCGPRFESLENKFTNYRNKMDFRSGIWGLIGGFAAIISIWLKEWFGK